MRNSVKFNCFCIFILLIPTTSLGQDFNFSLFEQNKTYYNPALTGIQRGLTSTNFIYRKQWLNFPGEFSTKHFNMNWKSYSSNGFGVFAISNIEGESFLTTNSFGANYSWRGDLDKYTGAFFQLGLSASYNIKKIDISKLTFSDQLDEIYGKVYGSSFVPDQNKRNYIDFSVGTFVNFSTIGFGGNTFTHIVGLALHHLTRPNESFQGINVEIPMKLTFHVQSKYQTKTYSINRRDKLSITPWVLYENKGEALMSSRSVSSFMCGVDFSSDPLTGGIGYRSHLNQTDGTSYNSMVFMLGSRIYVENNKTVYRLFYTYDLAINNYTKYTRDSHEIGLSMDFSFKRRRKCINRF